VSVKWPTTWFLLTLWETDPGLAARDFLARCGYGTRVTPREWALGRGQDLAKEPGLG
jgi:hypothetical protein